MQNIFIQFPAVVEQKLEKKLSLPRPVRVVELENCVTDQGFYCSREPNSHKC
jgi:hypothetical protein